MTQVGFIGLGTMGGPMAANLVKGGHAVKGFDINPSSIKTFVTNGGLAANSSADAAKNTEFVFTMLPNSGHVKTALFDENGALSSMNENTIYIDMSTIHPFETDAIREKLDDRGIKMIDAPIGRTSAEAAKGKSLLMVGGNKAEIQMVRPLFECMGDTIIDCGGPGTGARMKIVNNYMTTVLNVLTAEGLTLARSVGLDQNICIDVFSGTPAGRGHLSTTYPARVLQNNLTPAFMIDLADKDLGIALELADKVNAPSELGVAAKSTYRTAKAEGRGKQDWTAIFSSLQNRAGLSLPPEQEI